EDLPDPDRPVITISLSRGSSRSMFLRLCVRAPRMRMESIAIGVWGPGPEGVPEKPGEQVSVTSRRFGGKWGHPPVSHRPVAGPATGRRSGRLAFHLIRPGR